MTVPPMLSSRLAVRVAPLLQSAISPAPARTAAFVAMTCTASESDPNRPALSVTVTRTLSMPTAPYTWLALIDAVVVLPAFELPSPQVIVYCQGALFDTGSLNVTETPSVSPPCVSRSGPACTDSGASWHAVLPESVKVLPAMGRNFQVYPFAWSVSFTTPRVLLFSTSEFGTGGYTTNRPPPPVPATISRMPWSESRTPCGACGAERS